MRDSVEEAPSYLVGHESRFTHTSTSISQRNLLSFFNRESEAAAGSKFDVFLRLKPVKVDLKDSPLEIKDDCSVRYKLTKEIESYLNHGKKEVCHEYKFTRIFGPETGQKELFEMTCVNPLRKFIKGENCLLFAYGASNAGKSYTVHGKEGAPGMVFQTLQALFADIQNRIRSDFKYKPDQVSSLQVLDDKLQFHEELLKNHILSAVRKSDNSFLTTKSDASISTTCSSELTTCSFKELMKESTKVSLNTSVNESINFSVWVSFIEIYNENIYDLLDTDVLKCGQKRRRLNLGLDEQQETYVKNCNQICVKNCEEAYQVYLYGRHNLKMGATDVNTSSSRSHCIFSLKLVHLSDLAPSHGRISRFSLVDLAGIERAKRTNNIGERLNESKNINSSLHVLGRCLTAIRDNQNSKFKAIIPFRESKLTRLFKNALSGLESIIMIVNVSLDPRVADESLHVLKFSAIAKEIILAPVHKPQENALSRITKINMKAKYKQELKQRKKMKYDESSAAIAECSGISNETTISSQTKDYLKMIESLREELDAEKEKNLTLEERLRKELTEKFADMLKETDEMWSERLKNTEQILEENAEYRINYVKYHLQNSCSKRKASELAESLQDLSINETEDLRDKLESYEENLESYRNRCNQLEAEKTRLQFDLTMAQKKCRETQAMLSDAIDETDSSKLLNNMQEQLLEAENLLKQKDEKIQDLNDFIEEAKANVNLLQEENEEVMNRNSLLEHLLSEKESQVDKLNENCSNLKKNILELQKAKIEACQAQKEMEDEIKVLQTELKASIGNRECLKQELTEEINVIQGKLKESLQRENEIKSELESIKRIYKDMETRNTDLEDQLKSYKAMMKDIENELPQAQSLQQENELLMQQLNTLESDMANWKVRRDQQFKAYEDLLKREKEETEMQKREVLKLQEVLHKSVPTPKKCNYEEQIENLKEKLRQKDERLICSERKIKELEMLKSKEKILKDSSNESPASISDSIKKGLRKGRITKLSNLGITEDLEPEKNKNKNVRRTKKLFRAGDNILEVTPSDDVDLENQLRHTPNSMMRKLRNRVK